MVLSIWVGGTFWCTLYAIGMVAYCVTTQFKCTIIALFTSDEGALVGYCRSACPQYNFICLLVIRIPPLLANISSASHLLLRHHGRLPPNNGWGHIDPYTQRE